MLTIMERKSDLEKKTIDLDTLKKEDIITKGTDLDFRKLKDDPRIDSKIALLPKDLSLLLNVPFGTYVNNYRGRDEEGYIKGRLKKIITINEKNFTVIGLTERMSQGFISDGSDNNTLIGNMAYNNTP